MITFPNAKINLGLNIVERRLDGYHNIETVFYPVPLTDILEIVPVANGEQASLTCYGNPVDCPPEKNLVMRAYRLLQERYGLPPVAIHLSSMAATLGADCAFFIYNRPMMATGIGDVLSPIDVDLKGKTLLLVKPSVGVDTRTAYSRVTPHVPLADLSNTIALPVIAWDGLLTNDFEVSVFSALPQLWLIKAQLIDAGASYAAMSGSGSTIFGIFDNDKLAGAAADTFTDCATFVLQL